VRSCILGAGLLSLVLPGCGTKGVPTGTVAGVMLRIGGPPPGSPVPLPGEVTLTDVASGARFQASASTNGKFAVTVPIGTYRVTGQSPLVHIGDEEMVGVATDNVRVKRNRTSQANVYFSIK
jgi:hypothetical protein